MFGAVSPQARRSCFSWGTGLQSLGLALMVGGMLALGAFTAPVVFTQLPRLQAAPVMATIFHRYDMVLLIALGLVIVGEALRVGSKYMSWQKRSASIRGMVLMALITLMLFSITIVNPKILAFNQAGVQRGTLDLASKQFERTHKLSETLYKWELFCASLLLLLTPFAGTPNKEFQPHA